jgi:predicted RecB family nuclease
VAITPHLFEAYLKCSTKCWLRSIGEEGSGNIYADWLRTQNESYRNEGTRRLMDAFPHEERIVASSAPGGPPVAKWPFVADFVACARNLESHLHAVERVPSEARGKPAEFIPIRFAFTNKITKDDQLLLGFDALVLSETLGQKISRGKIIHGNDQGTQKVNTSASTGEVRKRIEKIAALISNSAPPDLVLNRHCAECEFQTRCWQKAMEADDLSLLSGMSEKERGRHRSKGIFTVTQLSYTFRPRRPPKRAKNPAKPHHFALQALALRENMVYIHGTPELPRCKSQVYLDIEGLPDRNFYYLIGALVVCDGRETFHSFWADNESEQAAIFVQFAEAIADLPDFRAFHFGDYDAVALRRVAAGLPDNHRQQIDAILHKSVNVLSVVYPHVYFPTYSNGLKGFAKHLGCERATPEGTGLQSIIWRNEWERSRDSDLREQLATYNKSDCLILRRLTEFMIHQTSSTSAEGETGTSVSRTSEMTMARPHWQMFAPKQYALEDLKHIARCAYFDYQREKVFVRTHREFRTINKNHRRLKRPKIGHSKVIDLTTKRCPKCGGRKLQPTSHVERHSLDLKYSKSGVRRAVTSLRCWSYRCRDCETSFSSRSKFARQQTYGRGLMSWCLYFNVVSGEHMLRVQKNLEDLFRIHVNYAQVYRFKRYVSEAYGPLNGELLQRILQSPVLHIDETVVHLRQQIGYVWVITSLDTVYFFYRPSREGSFLAEMLGTFSGVLVSDFYTAYDSVSCEQQKCLVHLVREIDEDLIHNPLDVPYKEMARNFGALLRTIIGTVDRYGLKKRHLGKHKREVERFLRDVDRLDPSSELVDKYRKRFGKYGAKMFTFLDHDGVPWNNNNAEHAIKRFAKYRRNADGRYTERSLKEYLVLASVLETCEFNNVNVLKFLLSEETTLNGLLRMAGRKTKAASGISASVS